MASDVETRLSHRMTAMRESGRFPPAALDAFASWVAAAPDEALFRVNPYDYASQAGLAPREAIDLMVNAARAGIFDFNWGLVCPSCSAFISSREGLRGLARERRCNLCLVSANRPIDDGVEVSFTVNPAVRRIRFHGDWLAGEPDRVSMVRDVCRVYFSSLAELGDALAGAFGSAIVDAAASPVGGSKTVEVTVAAPGAWRIVAPSVHTVAALKLDPAGASEAHFEVLDGYAVPDAVKVRPGPVKVTVVNRTDQPELLFSVARMAWTEEDGPSRPEAEDAEAETLEEAPPRPFLSGKQLLSTQSFRELFRAETLSADASLVIRNLAFLFTDLKASTQMYDRVGDLKALSLVREHFKVLRDVVAAHNGAIVKTIGDAVMATFSDPRDAVAAGVEMHAALEKVAPPAELALKVGVHAGPCVAIDSNERLDYFGQTVNIAARVQALAEGRELVLTDAVLREPGVAELLGKLGVRAEPEQAHLKGVSGAVAVHRARL